MLAERTRPPTLPAEDDDARVATPAPLSRSAPERAAPADDARGTSALSAWNRERGAVLRTDPARRPADPSAPSSPPRPRRATAAAASPGRRLRERERSILTASLAAGTVVVAVLCVYVQAYARVTQNAFEIAAVEQDLGQAAQEEQDLRAEIARMKLPAAVKQRALEKGMVTVERGRVYSRAAPSSAPLAPTQAARTENDPRFRAARSARSAQGPSLDD